MKRGGIMVETRHGTSLQSHGRANLQEYRKAACDFGIATYFRKCGFRASPRRGDILLTPDKRN